MRFDDTLETVLAADVSTPFGKASAWRQLVDLIGRQRAPEDGRALDLLKSIRDEVPLKVRAASTRALALAEPPYGLVCLCALDEVAVAAPVLRSAKLNAGQWIELLPQLSAGGRAVLRERRDLPAGVVEALATFVSDFTIECTAEAQAAAKSMPLEDEIALAEDADAPTMPATAFVSVGAAAKAIPVVAAALQQAADGGDGQNEAETRQSVTIDAAFATPTLAPERADAHEGGMSAEQAILTVNAEPVALDGVQDVGTEGGDDGTFEIAEVVARIDAFYSQQQDRVASAPARVRAEGFRFETDAQGVIRWVDGVSRGPLIGLSLEVPAPAGGTGVDGTVAGAFRHRAAFADARLLVAGESDAAGDWRISAGAAFDPITGRFAGYRGTARRPRADESASGVRSRGGAADSLRQLMHELRTPANAIAGFSEMIEHQMLGEVRPVYRERAGVIRDQARALLAAIDDLDIAARIEVSALRLQPGEVALRPVLARIVDDLTVLASARGTHIVLPADLPAVLADPRAVERLFARMLATLVSAAGEGEWIEVSARADDGYVAVSATRPQALTAMSGDALFAMDDEDSDAALLGTGFALRLLRNLARELSGALVIEAERLTVQLPATVTKSLEIVR